jgi:hypothetical protein
VTTRIQTHYNEDTLLILVDDYMIALITSHGDNGYRCVPLRNEKHAVKGSEEILLDNEEW